MRKALPTKPTITAAIIMQNAQAALAPAVRYWLEVLPELSSGFEVLIVDQDSTDGAEEVAAELVRDYPQVRYVRTAARGPGSLSQRRLLDLALGELVLWLDGPARPSFQLLRQVSQRGRTIRADAAEPAGLRGAARRLKNWMQRLRDEEPLEQVADGVALTVRTPQSRSHRLGT